MLGAALRAGLRRRPPPRRFQVDGKSIAPLLLRGSALGAAPGGWRTSFLVEHYALADWPAGYVAGRTRVNDCPANTYRALRTIDPTAATNTLYVEMTMVRRRQIRLVSAIFSRRTPIESGGF
jgi:hypothetical protein